MLERTAEKGTKAARVRRATIRASVVFPDLQATHSNDMKLDFESLLEFPDFDFKHDIAGIYNNLNRDTGKLKNFFVPRCTAPKIRKTSLIKEFNIEFKSRKRKFFALNENDAYYAAVRYFKPFIEDLQHVKVL